jgi:alcohol dehydrogenase class IV
MLPYVMRFNMVGSLKRYADLGPALGAAGRRSGMTDTDRAEAAIAAVERLADDIRVPRRLRDLKIPESGIPVMAEGVMKVTRLLANNPRTMTVQDAEAIYRSAY